MNKAYIDLQESDIILTPAVEEELISLKSQIAALQDEEKKIKDILIHRAKEKFGDDFHSLKGKRVTVGFRQTTTYLTGNPDFQVVKPNTTAIKKYIKENDALPPKTQEDGVNTSCVVYIKKEEG